MTLSWISRRKGIHLSPLGLISYRIAGLPPSGPIERAEATM